MVSSGSHPTEKLRIASDGDLTLTGADNVEIKMKCGTSSGNNILAFLNSGGTTRGNITYDSDNNFLLFNVNQAERLRITSSGALIIGRNPAQATGTNTQNAILTIKGYPNSETSAAILALVRGNNTTSTASGHTLGRIVFSDKQAGEYAFIEGEADANGAVGDTPGRLVFSVAPDNTSAPSEKLRISSDGSAYFYHGTTNHVQVSGTAFCNSVGAAPSPAGVCLAVGRDGGSNRSIHTQGHIQIANGYGIQFQSSSTGAILDDYEEGTHSPTFANLNNQSHVTTDFYTYVKVGRIVQISCKFTVSNSVNDASGFGFTIPFAQKASRQMVMSALADRTGTQKQPICAFSQHSQSYFYLKTLEGYSYQDYNYFSGNTIWVSGSYESDA